MVTYSIDVKGKDDELAVRNSVNALVIAAASANLLHVCSPLEQGVLNPASMDCASLRPQLVASFSVTRLQAIAYAVLTHGHCVE